jgi:DtxR family Mn-dependent transcriptional regulator
MTTTSATASGPAGTVPATGATAREREYLEVIYYLTARGEPVIAARIADWLKVSAPTVSNTLKRLERKGHITRDASGAIQLTATGLSTAEVIVRQHRLLECFLVDVMDMPWEVLHEEAVRLERQLSPRFEARIEQLVGRSPTCPHGNPVPGNRSEYDGTIRLDQAATGRPFRLLRIVEEAEEDTELMAYLYHHRLVPGTVVTVLEERYSGLQLQRADDPPVTLSREIATSLWGEPEP